jgi:hypothetical protein
MAAVSVERDIADVVADAAEMRCLADWSHFVENADKADADAQTMAPFIDALVVAGLDCKHGASTPFLIAGPTTLQ